MTDPCADRTTPTHAALKKVVPIYKRYRRYYTLSIWQELGCDNDMAGSSTIGNALTELSVEAPFGQSLPSGLGATFNAVYLRWRLFCI